MVDSLLKQMEANVMKYPDKNALTYILNLDPTEESLVQRTRFAGIAKETDALAVHLLASGMARGDL